MVCTMHLVGSTAQKHEHVMGTNLVHFIGYFINLPPAVAGPPSPEQNLKPCATSSSRAPLT